MDGICEYITPKMGTKIVSTKMIMENIAEMHGDHLRASLGMV